MMMIKTTLSSAACRRALAGRRLLSAAATDPTLSEAASACIELEDRYGAHNYHPLPVVLQKGKSEKITRFALECPMKLHPHLLLSFF